LSYAGFDVLKQVLTDARSEVEQQFTELLIFNLNASKCASRHGVLVSAPRRRARQTAILAVQKNIIADLWQFPS